MHRDVLLKRLMTEGERAPADLLDSVVHHMEMVNQHRNGGEAGMGDSPKHAIEDSCLKANDVSTRQIQEDYTLENVADAMQYQPWEPRQREAGAIVVEALTAAAKAILRVVPPGRFRQKALDGIVQARMDANAGISFRGRF